MIASLFFPYMTIFCCCPYIQGIDWLILDIQRNSSSFQVFRVGCLRFREYDVYVYAAFKCHMSNSWLRDV